MSDECSGSGAAFFPRPLFAFAAFGLSLGRSLAFSVEVVDVVCSAASTSLWLVIGRSHAISEVINIVVCSATTAGGRILLGGSASGLQLGQTRR